MPRVLAALAGMVVGCLIPALAWGQDGPTLYPGGPAQAIPVTIANPTSRTVYVSGVSVGVNSTDSVACRPDWFQGGSSRASGGGIAIPPRSTVTLPAKGLAAPSIRMIDSGTDQDGCQGTTVTFQYASAPGHAPAEAAAGDAGPGGSSSGSLAFTGLVLPLLGAAGLLLCAGGAALRGGRAER